MSYVVDGIGEFSSLTQALQAATIPQTYSATTLARLRAPVPVSFRLPPPSALSRLSTPAALAPASTPALPPAPATDDTMNKLIMAGMALLLAFAVYKLVTK